MSWRLSLEMQRRKSEIEILTFDQPTVVIGRVEPADLVIHDANVSRRHCSLTIDERGQVWIQDLGSSNGTFVNGECVREKRFDLADELYLGGARLRLAGPPVWIR